METPSGERMQAGRVSATREAALSRIHDFYLLVDVDNLPGDDCLVARLCESWIGMIPEVLPPSGTADLHVRYYGGWWDGYTASPARHESARVLEKVPAFLRISERYWRVQFHFADETLAPTGPGVAVRETFVRRPAHELGIKRSGEPICLDEDCRLKECRTWIRRRRACSLSRCALPFGEAWLRAEQKQVDVHLAADLITLAAGWKTPVHVAIASDDIDFAPALVAAAVSNSALESLCHLRCARVSSYMDSVLRESGVRIANVSLGKE